LKKIPNLYYRQNAFEYIGEAGVQSYQDPSSIYPYHLDPSNSLEGWQFKGAYLSAPMRLSPGTWHVRSTLTIKKDNLQIIGSGYHTVLQVSSSPFSVATGILAITGDNVLIEGVRFEGGSASMLGMIAASTVDSLTIRNCWFSSSGATNSLWFHHADKLTIENCVFSQTKASSDGMYILDSDDVMVKNNRVTATRNSINLDSTDVAVAAQRCNEGIAVANHVGVSGVIRYNASGSHRVLANNVNATLTAYV
jgi:hypothetical protein